MAKNIAKTSLEAYKSLKLEELRETYRLIIASLRALGEATSEQIAQQAKVTHDRIWKRMVELERMELVYKPGNKRPTKTGRNAFTYMLRGEGIQKITTERALKGKAVVDYSKTIAAIQKEIW